MAHGGVQDQLIALGLVELDREMHDVLLESIEETLTGLLSSEVVNALYLHLQTAHSISRDELPYRLETLCTTLDKIFGHSHKVICKAIARKFYSKLGLPYFDNPSRTLIEYVEEAKMKLRESEGQL